jgi:hypothetical protein
MFNKTYVKCVAMHNVDAHYNVLLWKVITIFFQINQVWLYTTQMLLRNLWIMK